MRMRVTCGIAVAAAAAAGTVSPILGDNDRVVDTPSASHYSRALGVADASI